MGMFYDNLTELSLSAQTQIHKQAALAYARNAGGDSKHKRLTADDECLNARQFVERIYSNAAAASMLQIAENTLYAITANLSQMQRLVEKILSGRYDDEFAARIAGEFYTLAEANRHALNPAADDHRTAERYPDERPAVVWVSLEQISIQSDVLREPEHAHRDVVSAIENVAAGLREIRQLLLELHRQSEEIYTTLQRQCDWPVFPERIGDAKTAAYRVGAKLIETAQMGQKSHTDAIAALAAKIAG